MDVPALLRHLSWSSANLPGNGMAGRASPVQSEPAHSTADGRRAPKHGKSDALETHKPRISRANLRLRSRPEAFSPRTTASTVVEHLSRGRQESTHSSPSYCDC